MKILLISNLYAPHARGGAEAVVETVAGGLVQRGYRVGVPAAGPRMVDFCRLAISKFTKGIFSGIVKMYGKR